MRDDSKLFLILSRIFRMLGWVLTKILCILFDMLFRRLSRDYRFSQLKLSDRQKRVIMIIILAFTIKFSCIKGVTFNYIGDYGYSKNMTKKECANLYEISKVEILRSIKSPEKVEFPELSSNGNSEKMKMSKDKYKGESKEKTYEIFLYADIEDPSYGILDRNYFHIIIRMKNDKTYKVELFDSGEKYKDMLL